MKNLFVTILVLCVLIDELFQEVKILFYVYIIFKFMITSTNILLLSVRRIAEGYQEAKCGLNKSKKNVDIGRTYTLFKELLPFTVSDQHLERKRLCIL